MLWIGGKIVDGISYVCAKIGEVFKLIAPKLYEGIKQCLRAVWEGTVLTFRYLVVIPLQFLRDAYFSVFKFLLIQLKAMGIVGELIFTLFGLVWILWPVYVAFYANMLEVYIPAAILTIVLIVEGRRVIIANS